MLDPPVAEKRPHLLALHGVELNDDYYWLRDLEDPAVIEYLRAENEYVHTEMGRLAGLQQTVYEEIRAKVKEDDVSAPAREGEWWYGRRTESELQYPSYVRWKATPDGPETLLLDQNELAGEHGFCGLGYMEMSPRQDLLAYAVDFAGDETFEIRFVALDPRRELDERIAGAYYGGAFSSDASHFFYTTLDSAHRPFQAWRHRLGTSQANDVLLYEELDQRFDLELRLSRDRSMVLIDLISNSTSETRYVPSGEPLSEPKILLVRVSGVRYQAQPRRGRWLVVTDDNAPNGRLLEIGPEGARELIGHDPLVKVAQVLPFLDHLIIVGRKGGNPILKVLPDDGPSFDVGFADEAYRLTMGENREYATSTVRVVYESFLCPRRIMDVDMTTGEQRVVKEDEVPGEFAAGDYVSYRIRGQADGVEIPITVTHRRALHLPAPTLVYGYGAYESVLDPDFDPTLFPLLDRGVVYAVAHIRGGGEMGRTWHLDGRMANKANTFTDFVAAAEYLIDAGIAAPGRLAARGLSAGGLLVGAVTVMRPDLWAAVVAEVPFVDVINTMLDSSLPLTVAEWEEWGDPALAEQFQWMNAYSPYDNTVAAAYPAMLVTAGLNDSRVAFWEPAKWVAKLRAVNTGSKPIYLHTDLRSGHSGPSGRYDHWWEEAFVVTFLLEHLLGDVGPS